VELLFLQFFLFNYKLITMNLHLIFNNTYTNIPAIHFDIEDFLRIAQFLFIIIPFLIIPITYYIVFYNFFFVKKYKSLKVLGSIFVPLVTFLSIIYYLEAFNLFFIEFPLIIHLLIYINVYIVTLIVFILFLILILWFGKNWILRMRYLLQNDYGPYILFGSDPTKQIKICGRLSKKSIRNYKKDKQKFHILYKEVSSIKTNKIINQQNSEINNNSKLNEGYWKRTPIELNRKGFWVVKLNKLMPNTEYIYQIPFINCKNKKKSCNNNFNDSFKFRTPPSFNNTVDSEFEFLYVSDLHASGHKIDWIKKLIENDCPNISFITSSGDTVSDGRIQRHWKTAIGQLSTICSQYPFMTSTGNHDALIKKMAENWKLVFPYDFADIKDGLSHFFIYLDSVFIFLDNYNAGDSSEIPSKTQIQWMDNLLTSLDKRIEKKFIIMHESMYSTSSRGMRRNLENILLPLIKKHQVTAVLTGHCHYFEIFYRDDLNNPAGTCFIISGGGGGSLERAMFRRMNNPPYLWESKIHEAKKRFFSKGDKKSKYRNDEIVKKYQIIGFPEYHVLHIKVAKNYIKYRVLGKNSNQLFSFTQKIK